MLAEHIRLLLLFINNSSTYIGKPPLDILSPDISISQPTPCIRIPPFSFLLVNIEMGFNGKILNFIGHDYGLLGGGQLPFDMNAEWASPIYDPWLELVKLRNESLSIVSHNTGWCELSPE